MDCARIDFRRTATWLLPVVFLAACGCQTVRTPEEKIAQSNTPRELEKTTMPDYVIEPPDLLVVEVLEALPGRNITGERLVRPDGSITLGFYGDVYVTGLTLKEAKEKIVLHLRKYLTDEALGIGLHEDEKGQRTQVSPADTSRVFVDIASYNSKYYYIQGDVAVPGRLSITGNETVLDAINFAGGLTETASVPNIRLVRPAPPGSSCKQVLPINYAAIVYAGDTTTNYQLLPGDRIVVYRDPIVRTTIFINRLAAPFNSVVNAILTYSFTARNVKSINIPINGVATSTTTNVNLPPTTGGPAR
jgi:polysaccharide export outer membrane protein